ncbi:uncharacterized protein LOC108140445 [Drosophila elegans]|uniref:uncharacterized protein LOC108140445 n=1 Tax=Drosophila elegans TaxID=30023 RepID=UPI0007E7F9ED|nr:uncharacterized protein LOC108140445 [Drosophila elegans]
MKKKKVLIVLSLILSLVGQTLQDEPKVSTPESAATSEPPAAAKEPSKISEPESSNKATASKCKSTEVLSENGCVDREFFLNRIIMRSWKDDGFEKAKARAGLVDNMQCREDEIRTPFGCEKPRLAQHREFNRVKVLHSRLERDKVRHGGYDYTLRHSGNDGEHKVIKRPRKLGPPITGTNRPRTYVFMPGRTLRKGRKCRTNEVTGRGSRCIHRRRHVKTTAEEASNENSLMRTHQKRVG